MIERKKIKGQTLTGGKKVTPPVKPKPVDQPVLPDFKPKKKEPMFKKLLASKVGKTVTSILGGVLGLGGSLGAGIEIEFAVIVAATMFVAIFMGIEKAKKFYDIFKKDRPEQNK